MYYFLFSNVFLSLFSSFCRLYGEHWSMNWWGISICAYCKSIYKLVWRENYYKIAHILSYISFQYIFKISWPFSYRESYGALFFSFIIFLHWSLDVYILPHPRFFFFLFLLKKFTHCGSLLLTFLCGYRTYIPPIKREKEDRGRLKMIILVGIDIFHNLLLFSKKIYVTDPIIPQKSPKGGNRGINTIFFSEKWLLVNWILYYDFLWIAGHVNLVIIIIIIIVYWHFWSIGGGD